jgi:hypothetical protein
MILHVLTACSRPERLEGLGLVLGLAAGAAGIDLRWHVAFDLERRHVGGQAVKNRLLDAIPADDPGWVWICDDDNAPHPSFLLRLVQLEPVLPAAVLFAQQRGPAEGGRILPAEPPRVGRVDAAQLVARRSFIGAARIPEAYDGDGVWIVGLWDPAQVVLVDEPFTLWNGADWVSVDWRMTCRAS